MYVVVFDIVLRIVRNKRVNILVYSIVRDGCPLFAYLSFGNTLAGRNGIDR